MEVPMCKKLSPKLRKLLKREEREEEMGLVCFLKHIYI